MLITLEVPDNGEDYHITLGAVLPFVAKVVRADALLKSIGKEDMIRLTSKRTVFEGVTLLQEAVREIMEVPR